MSVLFCYTYNLDSPVITDPEDPKFDLEKLVQSWEKQSS